MTEETKPAKQHLFPTYQEHFQSVKTAWVAIPSKLRKREELLTDIRAALPDWTLLYFNEGDEWTPDLAGNCDALIVPQTGYPVPSGIVAEIFRAQRRQRLIVRFIWKLKLVARYYGLVNVEKDGKQETWLRDKKSAVEYREKAALAAEAAKVARAVEAANAAARAEKKAAKAEKAAARAAKKAAKALAQEGAAQAATEAGQTAPTPPAADKAPKDVAPVAAPTAAKKVAQKNAQKPAPDAAKKNIQEAAPGQPEPDPSPRRFSVRKLIVPPR